MSGLFWTTPHYSKQLRLSAFALTGYCNSSRVASSNPTQGKWSNVGSNCSFFLGMTMSEEGEPRVLYTLLGVLILGVLDNGLTQMNVEIKKVT